jgi:Zn-dependent M32 family carboxypeptidase
VGSCGILIDDIYINTYRHDFSVHPLTNGLSDHDVQIITLSNIFISVPRHLLGKLIATQLVDLHFC